MSGSANGRRKTNIAWEQIVFHFNRSQMAHIREACKDPRSLATLITQNWLDEQSQSQMLGTKTAFGPQFLEERKSGAVVKIE